MILFQIEMYYHMFDILDIMYRLDINTGKKPFIEPALIFQIFSGPPGYT